MRRSMETEMVISPEVVGTVLELPMELESQQKLDLLLPKPKENVKRMEV